MSHVARSILLACWWALGSALAPVCVAATVSPYSTAQATVVGVGKTAWGIVDQTGRIVGGPQTTTPVSVGSGGSLTVQTAAKVPTKYGAVDAVVKRDIPYSKLLTPWKKVLRTVPLVATGLAVLEVLSESCIRPLGGVGAFEQCYEREEELQAKWEWVITTTNGDAVLRRVNPQAELSNRLSTDCPSCTGGVSCSTYTAGVWATGTQLGMTCSRTGQSGRSMTQLRVCNDLISGSGNLVSCQGSVIAGYEPVSQEAVDQAMDKPLPPGDPDLMRDRVFKLWKELGDLPDSAPSDARGVDATGLSDPTITGPTSVQGPKTTETTSTGTQVKNETSAITYQGNTTNVTNNTTITNINNQGDIVNEGSTVEQSQTECEKNPSAIGCLDLGEPPSGDIPRKDEQWQITAESLPGGACPGGFVWPVPGNPEFSWQPLCDRLPAVRAVLLVLSGVLAAWIVVGGLQS